MESIRKKMASLKIETDQLLQQASTLEAESSANNAKSDKCDCDIRDLQKKMSNIDGRFEECFEKLIKTQTTEEERDKEWKNAEEDVNNLSRRMLLLEEEAKRRDTDMANTVMDLCLMSKNAGARFTNF
jgi:chromosome segregation ATPase